MSTSIVAQRYANAFFACVRGQGQLEEVNDALGRLGQELSSQPLLAEFFRHPGISRKDKHVFVDHELVEYGIWVQRLLHYLVDEGRVELLPGIIQWFGKRYRDELGIAKLELTTAIELDESALGKLLHVLENKLSKRVVAKTVVDPDIIGGLVIRHEGMVYDGSVRTMLQQVNRCLGGGIGL
ncbi:MAG: ATP synthase F1 subunit delta [Firmicutes bacterium]|jgi:F-type H+-transporting ATPase subunit delta|nr:ATP synthase F1 subunit delta [Bacillota bacterium]